MTAVQAISFIGTLPTAEAIHAFIDGDERKTVQAGASRRISNLADS